MGDLKAGCAEVSLVNLCSHALLSALRPPGVHSFFNPILTSSKTTLLRMPLIGYLVAKNT